MEARCSDFSPRTEITAASHLPFSSGVIPYHAPNIIMKLLDIMLMCLHFQLRPLLPDTLADRGDQKLFSYQERKSPQHSEEFAEDKALSPHRSLFLIKSGNQIILL